MLKSLLAAVVTLALLTCPFPARAIGTRFKEVVEARSEGKV